MLGEEIMIIDYSTTIKSSGFPDNYIISAIYDSDVKVKLKYKKITVKIFLISNNESIYPYCPYPYPCTEYHTGTSP